MELYQAEKVAVLASGKSARQCRACGENMRPIRAFVDADTGDIIQILECECGERLWDD